MTGGALVVGYGNPLRSDDGLGWSVAQRLAEDPRLIDTTVITCHQLTPELALDLSTARLAVLIDASHGLAPGAFTVERMARSTAPESAWSHRLGPTDLLALTEAMYGHAPDVRLVSVGVASLEAGEGISGAVTAATPAIVDAVLELINESDVEPPASPATVRHA
jgi:hydrogenase maturation protease